MLTQIRLLLKKLSDQCIPCLLLNSHKHFVNSSILLENRKKKVFKILEQFPYCNWSLFSVLSRSEEDGIGLEELDSVQSDLETLLANAGKRLKQLENEVQILQNMQEKNGATVVKESIGKVAKSGKVVSWMSALGQNKIHVPFST